MNVLTALTHAVTNYYNYGFIVFSMDEALGDFLMAIKLDNSLSSAHTNAGLMIMNHIRKPRYCNNNNG